MDSLEKEILKYEKKEFKVQQKRTLKYGSRTFLKRKAVFSVLIRASTSITLMEMLRLIAIENSSRIMRNSIKTTILRVAIKVYSCALEVVTKSCSRI
jgi:hypothetical protein